MYFDVYELLCHGFFTFKGHCRGKWAAPRCTRCTVMELKLSSWPPLNFLPLMKRRIGEFVVMTSAYKNSDSDALCTDSGAVAWLWTVQLGPFVQFINMYKHKFISVGLHLFGQISTADTKWGNNSADWLDKNATSASGTFLGLVRNDVTCYLSLCVGVLVCLSVLLVHAYTSSIFLHIPFGWKDALLSWESNGVCIAA